MEKEIRKLKISASKASCMDIFGTPNLARFEFSPSDRDLIKGIARRMKSFFKKCRGESATYFALPKAFKMPQKGTVRLQSGLFFGKDNESKRKHAKTDKRNSHIENGNDSSLNSSKSADTNAIHEKPKRANKKLENEIRKQMKQQNSHCIPRTSNMTIVLREKSIPISIVEIAKDGNCLFGALAHQIFCCNVNTLAHHDKVAKLRADVVKHLNENMESFECLLKWRTENTEIDSYSFVNDLLSQPGYWGGEESLKAISEMYQVNIIIFNEGSTPLLPNGFNFDYKQTVWIAYRYDGIACSRNHYDSVYKIPDDLLDDIVEYLVSKN